MASYLTVSTENEKRLQLNTKSELDRLSLLSVPLLTRILSFLPTKEAVKTSVLSRRWRDIWTHLSSFDFDQKAFRKFQHNNNFMNFVDRVLILCRSNSNMKRFRLRCCCNLDESRVEGWIYYTKRRFVEVVELELRGNFDKVPYLLFTCQSLMKMKLDMCFLSLRTPFSINLPKLKVLQFLKVNILCGGGSIEWLISHCPKIENISMERCNLGSIENFDFSCCPYLETLSMKKCKFIGLKNFNISGNTLKRLVLDGCHDLRECEMKISAPHLICFNYIGAMVKKFSAKNLSSPIDAIVDLDDMNGSRVRQHDDDDDDDCSWDNVNGSRVRQHDTDSNADDADSGTDSMNGSEIEQDDDDSSADNVNGSRLRQQDENSGVDDGTDSSIATDSNNIDDGDGNSDSNSGDDGNKQNDCELWSQISTWADILKSLENAKSLRLCSAQLFSKSRRLLETRPIFFPSLKSLKVSTSEFDKDLVQVIVCILKASPVLETLAIEYERDDEEVGYWKAEDFLFECSLSHLKEVEIKRYEGNENELNFVKFVLKHAVVLESMVFIHINMYDTTLEERRQKSQELLRSPRASSRVAIVFS